MSDAGLDALNDASDIGADETGAPVGNETESSGGGHPAWQEVLEVLPTSLHSIVTPKLQEWDRGVQERFTQVQSQYDPYKDIISSAKPEDLQQAMQIAKMIESDPRAFYERLGQAVGANSGQGQQGTPADDDEDIYDLGAENDDLPPAIKQQMEQMRQQQEMLVQHVQSQMQEEANAKAEKELEATLTSLREKHGDFDEEFVITWAQANGGNFAAIEKGVEKYNQLVGRLQGVPAPGSNLPKVHAPGGATPSTAIDPTTLSGRDTKSLVVNLLQQQAAAAQNN